MDAINMIWGVCGAGVGVVFATICLTIAVFYDDVRERKKR